MTSWKKVTRFRWITNVHPPEYEEAEDELEGDSPDDVPPHHPARMAREDEAKAEDDKETEGGDKSLWFACCVGKDEDCYRCHHSKR